MAEECTYNYVKLLHDNANLHKPASVTMLLENDKVIVLSQPPYSPDMVTDDFFLIPRYKIWKFVENIHVAFLWGPLFFSG